MRIPILPRQIICHKWCLRCKRWLLPECFHGCKCWNVQPCQNDPPWHRRMLTVYFEDFHSSLKWTYVARWVEIVCRGHFALSVVLILNCLRRRVAQGAKLNMWGWNNDRLLSRLTKLAGASTLEVDNLVVEIIPPHRLNSTFSPRLTEQRDIIILVFSPHFDAFITSNWKASYLSEKKARNIKFLFDLRRIFDLAALEFFNRVQVVFRLLFQKCIWLVNDRTQILVNVSQRSTARVFAAILVPIVGRGYYGGAKLAVDDFCSKPIFTGAVQALISEPTPAPHP